MPRFLLSVLFVDLGAYGWSHGGVVGFTLLAMWFTLILGVTRVLLARATSRNSQLRIRNREVGSLVEKPGSLL